MKVYSFTFDIHIESDTYDNARDELRYMSTKEFLENLVEVKEWKNELKKK